MQNTRKRPLVMRFAWVLLCLLPVLFLLIRFINQIHYAILVGMGVAIWALAAKFSKRKMLDPAIAKYGFPATLLLLVITFLMPRVSFLPCPAWVERTVVKQSDYSALSKLFDKSLPDSFQILAVNNPGYNLLFNGPDGPRPVEYQIRLNAGDFSELIRGLELKRNQNKYILTRFNSLTIISVDQDTPAGMRLNIKTRIPNIEGNGKSSRALAQ